MQGGAAAAGVVVGGDRDPGAEHLLPGGGDDGGVRDGPVVPVRHLPRGRAAAAHRAGLPRRLGVVRVVGHRRVRTRRS